MPVSFLFSSGMTTDGLGRTGGRRNDVFQDATATAPVLGRAIDGLLASRMHGHQAALDAPLDDLEAAHLVVHEALETIAWPA